MNDRPRTTGGLANAIALARTRRQQVNWQRPRLPAQANPAAQAAVAQTPAAQPAAQAAPVARTAPASAPAMSRAAMRAPDPGAAPAPTAAPAAAATPKLPAGVIPAGNSGAMFLPGSDQWSRDYNARIASSTGAPAPTYQDYAPVTHVSDNPDTGMFQALLGQGWRQPDPIVTTRAVEQVGQRPPAQPAAPATPATQARAPAPMPPAVQMQYDEIMRQLQAQGFTPPGRR